MAGLSAHSGLSSSQKYSSSCGSEPCGAPGSGGIYNPSSKSLAFASTFAFKEGATRRRANQTAGPHPPSPPHRSSSGGSSPKSLQNSDLLILPPPRPGLDSRIHPDLPRQTNINVFFFFFPHKAEIDKNFQMSVSSWRRNF